VSPAKEPQPLKKGYVPPPPPKPGQIPAAKPGAKRGYTPPPPPPKTKNPK
jgi:hypothetical protein